MRGDEDGDEGEDGRYEGGERSGTVADCVKEDRNDAEEGEEAEKVGLEGEGGEDHPAGPGRVEAAGEVGSVSGEGAV